jgi:hypothetical protein
MKEFKDILEILYFLSGPIMAIIILYDYALNSEKVMAAELTQA